MIDPTDPAQFLERMHRDAEWLARDCHGGKRWTAREGQIVRDDGKVIAECPLNAHARLTASVLLALVGSPEAVLRRIAAERKALAKCQEALAEEKQLREYCGSDIAQAVIRALAEGWGWQEEQR